MTTNQPETMNTTADIIIRPYKQNDLECLLSCWDKADGLAHSFLPEAFRQQVRQGLVDLYLPNTETWGAESDGKVIGFIALAGNEVGGLFLDPAFHGKRIGKALMDKARELRGNLEVEVFKNNTIGRAFYERYGFGFMEEKLHDKTGETLLRLKLRQSLSAE